MPPLSPVILESPYNAPTPEGIEANVAYARQCIRDALSRGEAPIASHLLFTQPGILRDDLPEERALGIQAGHAWRDRADRFVFYTDLKWSRGMLSALHDVCLCENYPFRLRALHGPVLLPTVLCSDLEARLRAAVD